MEPPPARSIDDEDHVLAEVLAARARVSSDDHRVIVDAGDDAAVLADGTAVTVDALVEGVHWDQRLQPEHVGWKLAAVSVADLAATGARPAWAVLTLALPAPDAGWVRAFARGLADALATWDVRLVGGDTVRTAGPRLVSLTMGGRCVAAPLTRAGARPGHDLWVTGTLGLAGLGWREPHPPAAALAALRRPRPPLAFGLAVAEHGLASAAMDLSDGLERDLPRLARASGVGAQVEVDLLPADPALPQPQGWVHQVCGGEDHELLLAAPPEHADALRALAQAYGVRLTRIGRCDGSDAVVLTDRPWPGASFAHFAPAAPR